MTTSRLTARLHPPLLQLNTMASSRLLPPPRLSTTRLRHVVPHSQLTPAFITSLAATPRTLCCSPSQPPPLRLIQTAGMALTFMSSTHRHGKPRWRHRCATFLSAMTSRPLLVQTVPTRCPVHYHHRQGWEAQRVGETSPLQDHQNLRSVPPQDFHLPLLSAHLRTPIVCLAQPPRRTETTVCLLVPGVRLYAATLLVLWIVHVSEKVCALPFVLMDAVDFAPFHNQLKLSLLISECYNTTKSQTLGALGLPSELHNT